MTGMCETDGLVRPSANEWALLRNFAQSEMAFSGEAEPTAPVIGTVFGAVEGFDDETLERMRFQGLKLVMCGIARSLHQPEVRQGVVNQAAHNLVSDWYEIDHARASGLLVTDIAGPSLNDPFIGLAQASSDMLPRGTQLLADVLTVETNRRKHVVLYPYTNKEPHEKYHADIIAGTPTTNSVAINSLTGASEVWRTAYTRLMQPKKRKKDSPPTVAQIARDPALRELDLQKVARRSAALRIDEINLNLGHFLDTDDSGVIIFRQDRMVQTGKLALVRLIKMTYSSQALLHRGRLTCPALGVNDLIPSAMAIVHDIALQGQRTIEQLQADGNVGSLAT